MNKQFIMIISAWTLFVAGLIVWDFRQAGDQALEEARIEARAIWDHNVGYRKWVTHMGGVYVKRDKLQPNPYLNIQDRDKTTTDGVELTMANPAYMTSQVFEVIQRESPLPIINRIVSDNYLNPKNRPDEWETKGLRAFRSGEEETSEVSFIDGQPYMRLFKPMVTEEGCLKCHGHQGYEVGEIRGGISVAVPMKTYIEIEAKRKKSVLLGLLLIWGTGAGAIVVSARKMQTNNKLIQESEARLRQLFDTAAVPLCLADKDGVLVDVNDSFVRTFGFTRDDVPTLKEWWQLAYPDPDYRRWAVSTWEAAVRRAAAEKTDIEPMEYRVTRKNGEVLTVVISGNTFGDNFLATFFDITGRKRAEEALRKSTEVVEKIFEMNTTCIAYMDSSFYFIKVNSEYARADGKTPEYFIGKNHFDLFPDHENEAIFRKVVETGEQYTARARPFEYKDHPERGVSLWDWNLTPVRAPGGGVEALILSLVNVTERIKVQEDLCRLNEELEARVAERTARLEEKNSELERLNRLFVGRELRMVELKAKIEELEDKIEGLKK